MVEHSLIHWSEDSRFQLRRTWSKERSRGDRCRTAKESSASDACAAADKMRVIRRMKKEACKYERSQESEYQTHVASILEGECMAQYDVSITLTSVVRKKLIKVGAFNGF